MCHQVAEGLPDSFVFDRVGAGQWATIDIHPRRTPTARASYVEDVVEVDSDSDVEAAKETQDRIIAGVAMSVAAVNAPDVRALDAFICASPSSNLCDSRFNLDHGTACD